MSENQGSPATTSESDTVAWTGPPCLMCNGTGVDRLGPRCRACNGHGREADPVEMVIGGYYTAAADPDDTGDRTPVGELVGLAGDRALIRWCDHRLGTFDVATGRLRPAALQSLAELRRAVVAGCRGGAMLYDDAENLVDQYTATVELVDRSAVPRDRLRELLTDVDRALLLVRRAIADPAQFLPRAGYGTPDAETITSWSARAVLAALQEVSGG